MKKLFRLRPETIVMEPGKQSRWMGGTKIRDLCQGAKTWKIVMLREMGILFSVTLKVGGIKPTQLILFFKSGEGGI